MKTFSPDAFFSSVFLKPAVPSRFAFFFTFCHAHFFFLSCFSHLAVPCRLIKEFSIKACKVCCFSHGGQYFAAVNGNTISIYNTYTFDNVGNLRLVITPSLILVGLLKSR